MNIARLMPAETEGSGLDLSLLKRALTCLMQGMVEALHNER